jgi:hypothetical protein
MGGKLVGVAYFFTLLGSDLDVVELKLSPKRDGLDT